MDRRGFMLSGLLAIAAAKAKAQSLASEPPSPQPFGRFTQAGALSDNLSTAEIAERVTDSPAPAGPPGRWVTRAMLPIPTSEMGGGTASAGRLHIIGGWVNRSDHHVYDPAEDRWVRAAPLPRGANHIPVAADAGRVYALGGFADPNTNPFTDAYAYDTAEDRWTRIAPLPRARGAGGAAVLEGRIHLVGARRPRTTSGQAFLGMRSTIPKLTAGAGFARCPEHVTTLGSSLTKATCMSSGVGSILLRSTPIFTRSICLITTVGNPGAHADGTLRPRVSGISRPILSR